jgi:hypothetical protein
LKKWFAGWWKKVITSLAGVGTVLGFLDACGIIPDGHGSITFIAAILIGTGVSIVWNFIALSESNRSSGREIDNRIATFKSLKNAYHDKTHKFTYIFRQDLLDYSSSNGKDFISIRVLKGYNSSNCISDGLIYLECTEYRARCSDIKIRAIDMNTGNPLRVEFIDRNEKDKYHEFPFKIFFHTPLNKGDSFEIGFIIDMLNELDVLKEDDEIMSISLSRYLKGVDELEFNVCLNFNPSTAHAEHMKKGDFVYDKNKVVVEKYEPTLDIEKKFSIEWSAPPYIIRWKCGKPKYSLYAINYRK